MTTTENFALPQFGGSDRIHHDDFNDAFRKIDAAIPHIVTGSYVGTGEYGEDHPNELTFDFAPKAVRIITVASQYGQEYLATEAELIYPMTCSSYLYSQDGAINAHSQFVEWSGNTVRWYSCGSYPNAEGQQNETGKTYAYIAIG